MARTLNRPLVSLAAVLSALVVVAAATPTAAWAGQSQGVISGAVLDPLGGRVAGAKVALMHEGQPAADTSSDARGEFAFRSVDSGRYRLAVTAAGFEPHVTDPFFVSPTARVVVDLDLQIGLTQDVVVTAAATELPQSQSGAQVTVIDHETLSNLGKLDVLEAIRLAPATQVVQTGPRGGLTSMFVRGGNSNFNKLLIDGVSANDIGGAVDLAQLASTGVDRIEVLREPNSVLYGSDALTGVVSVTTLRGRTSVPELTAAIDGGNLGTFHNDVAIGGTAKRVDYFADVSHLQTDNAVPNNAFRNTTLAGRFGVALGGSTDLSGTVRRVSTEYGSPNAFDLFRIADDSSQTTDLTFASVNADSQITDRWRSSVRFGYMNRAYHYVNPAPTGIPVGGNYAGQTVTIQGANGYAVTGQAILDFGGTYPQPFDSGATRRTLLGQTSYQATSAIELSAGVRLENEDGFSQSSSRSVSTRTNAGGFVEARASLSHLHVNGGLGVDHNAVFGVAATPRVSVAAYLRDPSATSKAGDTKLTFNAGLGIKAPSIAQELSSLYDVLQSVPQGSALIAASHVSPIGPERSRSVDVGIEQGVWGNRARLRAVYFDNEFTDLIESVGKTVLPQVGVPLDVAAALPLGAYVNSQSFRARGLETSTDLKISRVLRVAASYTYLDAVVLQSFASGALRPAINPAFPTIPIGAFSPLVGAHPFRRPRNSGTLLASYAAGPAQVTVAGSFFGKADDSTFLSDVNFGNSMLLPNHDLAFAYQKVDLSGSYRLHPRVRLYASIENVLDRHYEAVFGYPALPIAVRTGLAVTLGGDRKTTP